MPSPALRMGRPVACGEQIGRAGVGAAQDDAFGAEGAEGEAGVFEGLAFFDAGGLRADEGGVGAEGFGGEFEGGAGARARLVEEERDAALERGDWCVGQAVFVFERIGGFEDAADFGRRGSGGDGGAG